MLLASVVVTVSVGAATMTCWKNTQLAEFARLRSGSSWRKAEKLTTKAKKSKLRRGSCIQRRIRGNLTTSSLPFRMALYYVSGLAMLNIANPIINFRNFALQKNKLHLDSFTYLKLQGRPIKRTFSWAQPLLHCTMGGLWLCLPASAGKHNLWFRGCALCRRPHPCLQTKITINSSSTFSPKTTCIFTINIPYTIPH